MQIESMQSSGQNLITKPSVKINNQGMAQTKQFEQMFNVKENVKIEKENKLNEMVDNIDKLKRVLDFDLTIENLNEYKEAVKSFIDYYTKNELKMENHFLTDRQGYQKKLSIIKTMDEKVNDINTNFLESPLGHVETLKKIGEIQGLVVNLLL